MSDLEHEFSATSVYASLIKNTRIRRYLAPCGASDSYTEQINEEGTFSRVYDDTPAATIDFGKMDQCAVGITADVSLTAEGSRFDGIVTVSGDVSICSTPTCTDYSLLSKGYRTTFQIARAETVSAEGGTPALAIFFGIGLAGAVLAAYMRTRNVSMSDGLDFVRERATGYRRIVEL